MQCILHFTCQPGSKASSSTSSSTFSLLNLQSTCHLTPLIPRRVRRLTVSSFFLIDNNTKSGDQDDSILREPPLAN